jgi:hypothetical protein
MRNLTSLLVVFLGLTGCATYTNVRTARVLDPGQFEFSGIAGVYDVPGDSAALPFTSEIGFRWGVAPRVDVGFNLTFNTVETSATVQLLRSRCLDIAVGPGGSAGLALAQNGEANLVGAIKVPLLLGLNLGSQGQHQLILAPTLVNQWSGGAADFALLVGGSAGFAIAVSEHFHVVPLLGVFVPVSGSGIPIYTYGASYISDTWWPVSPWHSPVIIQGGIGFTVTTSGQGI